VYEKTAAKPGFRFFGGVVLGEHVSRAELLERYHAVVYAIGTGDDNRLGIPGDDRPGGVSRDVFVAWYNGHPESFDLSAERAVVIGNGNMAIDVARMLLLDPDELALTDTADPRAGAVGGGAGAGRGAAGSARPGTGGVHEPGVAGVGGDDRREHVER
jgi:ferredoxin/flavodoxin---NADP+ reductase